MKVTSSLSDSTLLQTSKDELRKNIIKRHKQKKEKEFKDVNNEKRLQRQRILQKRYLKNRTNHCNPPFTPRNHAFVFIITSYNNASWYKRNLDSVINQSYTNWRIVYVDDASTDNTRILVITYLKIHGLSNKCTLIKHEKNYKQGYARYVAFQQCNDNEICCLLDGDDWLYDNTVLEKLNQFYNDNQVSITYGKYMMYENGENTRMTGYREFPKDIIEHKSYQHYSIWTSVHLRTGYAKLFKSYPYDYLLDFNGELISASTDQNEMFWVLYHSQGKHQNTGFITMVYNKDASLQYSNSYYHIETNMETKLYRTEIEYFLKLNKLNRYSKTKTILIVTSLDVHNTKLQRFCDMLNHSYKLIFKNKLVAGINDIKIPIDYVIYYEFNDMSYKVVQTLLKHCEKQTTNKPYSGIDVFQEDKVVLQFNEYTFSIEYKDVGEYHELYNYSIVLQHHNPSVINQHVDKVYCINLIDVNDTLESFLSMAHKYNIDCEILRMTRLADVKSYMGIFNTLKCYDYPGELGVLLSHLICYIDAHEKKYTTIIVLEDDCKPILDLNTRFTQCLSSIIDKRYVYLGASQHTWLDEFVYHPYYYNAWRTCGAFAIYIHKELFPLLINDCKEMLLRVDWIPWNYYNTVPDSFDTSNAYYGINKESVYYGKCIVLYPNLFIADVSNSNIREGQDMKSRSKVMKWDLKLYDL
jgi:glycosyltransferase involved in cell wall biosynthesis